MTGKLLIGKKRQKREKMMTFYNKTISYSKNYSEKN